MKSLLFYIPKLAWALSGQSLILFLKTLLKLWYFLLSRKILGVRNDFKLFFVFNGSDQIIYLRHPMDIAVLREIYVDREYDWCPIDNPKVILDLGAHFGDTALYYSAVHKEATIVAVEPSPENYQRLQDNVSSNQNIIPVNAAIGANDCHVNLHLMPSSLGHSVIGRPDATATVSIEQMSLSTLFKKCQINTADLIKFDIEGAEFEMFNNTNPADFSSMYIGELHFDLTSTTKDSFLENFNEFSVEMTEIRKDRFLFKAIKK